ncbi:MAG: folate-binding protein [Pseudomonadota bacterium]
MPIEHLKSRAVISVSGADAGGLLQRVVTANLDNLGDDMVRDCALLTPQGKVLFQFLISRHGDGFLMDCPETDRDALLKRLTMYRLRSDVALEKADLQVLTSADAFEGSAVDERADAMGHRAYSSDVPANAEDERAYHSRRIGIGVPEIGSDYEGQSVFAHEALLDLTHGIDFRKGCYVGQEVVSRVEHRSSARKRFVRVAADIALPERGIAIMVDGKSVGTMGSAIGGGGLALVRVDKLSTPNVQIGDVTATLHVPTFARFILGLDPKDG